MNTSQTAKSKADISLGMIGPVIKEARQAASLSQDALARAVGVAREHISRIETGVHSPSVDLLIQIAKALGTTGAALVQKAEDQAHTTADAKPASTPRRSR